MRALVLALVAMLIGGCVIGGNAPFDAGPGYDAGRSGPSTLPLTEVVGTFTVTYDTASQSATVSATFATSGGSPVVLMGMQSVSVGPHGGALLALTSANGSNPYTAVITNATSATQLDIKVDEPSMGVLTSTITVPPAVDIAAPAPMSTASLSGFSTTWTPVDSSTTPSLSLTSTLTLSQANATPPEVTKTFANDPGTYAFTVNDLAAFGQGTPVLLTVQVGETLEGAIQLLMSSSVQVERSASETLTPGP